jgi:hypothetical protein
MFRSSHVVGTTFDTNIIPSGGDHLLNTISTNNNIGNIDDRHNVPQTDKSNFCADDKMLVSNTEGKVINEPSDKIICSDHHSIVY